MKDRGNVEIIYGYLILLIVAFQFKAEVLHILVHVFHRQLGALQSLYQPVHGLVVPGLLLFVATPTYRPVDGAFLVAARGAVGAGRIMVSTGPPPVSPAAPAATGVPHVGVFTAIAEVDGGDLWVVADQIATYEADLAPRVVAVMILILIVEALMVRPNHAHLQPA